jgi:hypothetical protein
MLPPAVAASAAAAKALGYAGIADLIETEQLSPNRIANLFYLSVSAQAGRDGAIVLLAGAIARHRASPEGWNGDLERELALDMLVDEPHPDLAIAKLAAKAAKLLAAR